MADKKTHSNEDAVQAWNDHVGRQDQYELREVEDGVQLIDKDTGSLTIQAKDATELVEKVGSFLIEPGTTPEEFEEDGADPQFTERGALMTPTQPNAVQEAQGRGDLGSVKPEDQDR